MGVVKTKSASALTKELDSIFAIFIKLRDCDDQGTVTCFITGERVWWRDADAAHFHNRQHMGTRWHENNVHACSIASNRFDQDHLDQYDRAMRAKYTPLQMTLLEAHRRSIEKFTRVDLEDKILHYKEEVKKLRASKKI